MVVFTEEIVFEEVEVDEEVEVVLVDAETITGEETGGGGATAAPPTVAERVQDCVMFTAPPSVSIKLSQLM